MDSLVFDLVKEHLSREKEKPCLHFPLGFYVGILTDNSFVSRAARRFRSYTKLKLTTYFYFCFMKKLYWRWVRNQ